MVTIKLQRLPHGEDLPVPAFQTDLSAGADIRAAVDEPLTLHPGERALIPCGFNIEIPTGYEVQMRPRSGLALKYGVTVLNAPGTIDADYRGEIGVLLINMAQEPFVVTRGLRCAQMVVQPVVKGVTFEVATELTPTDRPKQGWGSTGIS